MNINEIKIQELKKKTKMVCTIGPASEDKEMLRKLLLAGMNVMRLNFSHGTHEEHEKKIKLGKELSKECKKNLAIMLDTKGPEIRTGDFENGVAEFKIGQVCVITPDDIVGTSDRFTITYKDLYNDVKQGGFILVNDGQISLQVDHVEGKDIYCVCANDGTVKNKRGINVPGIRLGFDYLSERDIDDLTFGCQQKVNFVAASFVRRAQDVIDVKKLLIANGCPEIQVIAKIENQEGVENMDEILNVADGIMVARGDLGVEVPAEDVPLIQKKLIAKCREKGKVVITATQMLESMQQNPRPTRAEVSDVANAIYDGTDAIMLSGESASGKYPEEAVETMARIAVKTEETLNYENLFADAVKTANKDTSEAICMSVADIAARFDIKCIVVFTETGGTAKRISRYRPNARIIAATPSEEVTRTLALNWGVKGVTVPTFNTRENMIQYAKVIAKENEFNDGDKIIVTSGQPGTRKTSFLEVVEL